MTDHMQATVLVVDDDRVSRHLLQAMLQRAGYASAGAGDGRAALALLAEQPVDVVLLDLRMPVLDGPGTLAAIRRGEVGRPDLPVIVLSAVEAPDGDDVLPVQGRLCKPVLEADCLALVQRVLSPSSFVDLGPSSDAGVEVAVALLDADTLAQLQALGPVLCGELLQEFLDHFPQQLQVVAGQLRSDPAAAAELVHRLIGTAGAVGAHRLAHAIRELEQALLTADTQRQARAWAQLQACWTATRTRYRAELPAS